jgi:hypothetical protein
MKRYKIKVTADDITEGVAGDCCRCPVARATLRALRPLFNCVRVAGPYARLLESPDLMDTVGVKVELSEHVQRWISTFDSEKPVKPFTFTLEIP